MVLNGFTFFLTHREAVANCCEGEFFEPGLPWLLSFATLES